ncbi:ATP-binding protein [Flindersiella endophytica]
MSTRELEALRALTFNWTRSQEDVWAPSPYHVEGLHAEVADLIRRGIDEAAAGPASSPLGIAIEGERGVGKTHLLGWTRQQVQRAGGYFFLVGISSKQTFWEEVLGSILDGLQPHTGGDQSQLERLLDDLASRTKLTGAVREAVTGRTPPVRADIDTFIAALRDVDRTVGLTAQDMARALVLLASPDQQHQDIGYYFLTGDDVELSERRAWGIRSRPKSLQYLINELSRLFALSGPTVVAVDQIDALIDDVNRTGAASDPDGLVPQVASGLMALRDLTRRTLTVISCLPESWNYIRTYAVDTVTDRFRPARQLKNLPNPDIGLSMIAKRFTVEFANVGFEPPYPTWPILPAAFEESRRFTARALLKRIEAHVNRCLSDGVVRELDRLGEWEHGNLAEGGPAVDDEAFALLDKRLAELRAAADVAGASDPKTEDTCVPPLLDAALEAWIRERGGDEQAFEHDLLPRTKNPALHASLRQVIDERTERKRQWAFRAIGSDNGRNVQARLRNAVARTGLDGESTERRLYVLRNQRWPSGRVTEQVTADFAEKGGVALAFTGDDLRTFDALGKLLAERPPHLDSWLVSRQPAGSTDLLGKALADVAPRAAPESEAEPEPDVAGPPRRASKPKHRGDVTEAPGVLVGTSMAGGAPVELELESLRKHAVVFAGSGSGKTVLLRRIVEECALQGVSAIVLDPNNDLARLGDTWPEPPSSWLEIDAERAREFHASTDVVVWTPLRENGRPLVFQPLPAFADIRDDEDEFRAAVYAAVEAVAPRVNADRTSDKARLERAVLTESLSYFGRMSDGGLPGFIEMLSDLPNQASDLPGAYAAAADLARRLAVARVNDPLFGGSGTPADPSSLLTPAPGKRARISVISMVGLPSEQQRQSFVNQLQLALFSWIKKHPAGDRPLGGLLVMDEAQTLAPSAGRTVSTRSTLMLASQARKYGLGLVFATQAPKGLHNHIPGNATTQFFGLLNHPVQIEAARSLARAKGGDVPDISRLSRGQFYLATEGRGFRKTQVPMCLSYHPSSPLTEEEVIAKARQA